MQHARNLSLDRLVNKHSVISSWVFRAGVIKALTSEYCQLPVACVIDFAKLSSAERTFVAGVNILRKNVLFTNTNP